MSEYIEMYEGCGFELLDDGSAKVWESGQYFGVSKEEMKELITKYQKIMSENDSNSGDGK